ncbi:MAG: hypothetical protein PHZ25_04235 [Candidatus Pacebacteria bacterium]|nr:hypothetical protein [Candidatus Paceibacterota bacterium]
MSSIIKKFFLDIRESDESSKTRWVWIFSIFSFLFVLGIWSLEVNYRLASLFPPDSKKEPGIIETTKQGALVIMNKIRTNVERKKIMEIEGVEETFSFSPLSIPVLSPKEFPKL